ncbi:hypothetical protein C9439_04065 [archaeon SCG-AAA382B04]|nr:hypothetical protein C9439_04065 [archaeon SCG-AAA382B04]
MKETAIIGIDGVPYRLMEEYSDEGVMPNFRELREEGYFSKMNSSIPPISSISWSSMITGKNPGEHGVYGFTELIPGSYNMSFPDFRSLDSPTYWQMHDDKRSIVINVPTTYPAQKLNGFHVSGFVSPNLEKAVYPKEELSYLEEIGYKVDVDSEKAHKSLRLFLDDLFDTLEKRIELYRGMWEREWDIFTLVFTGSDRLGHFMWNAFKNKDHEHHQRFKEYFRKVDEIIGEIAERHNGQLAILSDHGMEQIQTNVYLNKFLQKQGFLDLNEDKERYKQITQETTAFAMDPGRIYLHKQNKYPNGSVKPKEEEKIIKELKKAFKNFKYEGRNVVKEIYRRNQIYSGSNFEDAPDLVILPNKGLRFRGKIEAQEVFEEDVFSGKHTYEDSFLYLKNTHQVPNNKPSIEDVLSYL